MSLEVKSDTRIMAEPLTFRLLVGWLTPADQAAILKEIGLVSGVDRVVYHISTHRQPDYCEVWIGLDIHNANEIRKNVIICAEAYSRKLGRH